MKLFYFILISIGFNLTGFSQDCFSTPAFVHSDSMPIYTCPADFNGDGNIDVAVGNGSSPSISVFLGTGTGSFGTPTHFTVTCVQPEQLTSADFNNDGIADIATANAYPYTGPYTDNVSVLFGTGTGTFGAAIGYTIGGPGSGYLVHGITNTDLNGDGLFDLVAVGDYKFATIFLNTGSGNFGTPTHCTTGVFPRAVASTDFNNDGKADIVANDTGGVSVLLGNGTGGLGAFTHYQVGNDANTSEFCIGDFNGDGNKDIAVTRIGIKLVGILLGDGLGNFSLTNTYTTITTMPRHITSADFDGDCNLDLAVEMGNTPTVEIFLGNGNGTFNSPTSFFVGNAPVGVCATDLDGDHKPDLAFPATQMVKSMLNCSIDYCLSGVSATANKKEFSVYPNPAVDRIMLKLNQNPDKENVIIQNSLGQTIKSCPFSENIDVSGLAPGVYHITVVINNGESHVARFIKQ